MWHILDDAAGLRPVPGVPSPDVAADGRSMTEGDLQVVSMFNAMHLEDMDVAAGSLVKTLLMELTRRGVYLFLNNQSAAATRSSTACSRAIAVTWCDWPRPRGSSG